MRSAPVKREIFGVEVSATDYAEVVAFAIDCARAQRRAIIDLMPVHGLMTAARDASYRARMNAFDIVAPDGQPVRWALNSLHHAGLTDRVYGPELMRRLCRAAAEAGAGVYLYGSSPEVIERLKEQLCAWDGRLTIAGAESPPFRPLTTVEDAAVIERINASGAGLLFLGTGCPRQELFAFDHRHSIRAVQVCLGAAFDFHAGVKAMAPAWMQRNGLEWLFRLASEPRRLWRRYLVTNTLFLAYFALALLKRCIGLRGKRVPGAAPIDSPRDALVGGD